MHAANVEAFRYLLCSHLHVLDPVEPLLCEPKVEKCEAYTNLDNVKITYIYLHVLDPVEPLLCELNVENCGSIY
jgi:hypothetical protein